MHPSKHTLGERRIWKGFLLDPKVTLKHPAWGQERRQSGVGGPLNPGLGLAGRVKLVSPPQFACPPSRWGSIWMNSHGYDTMSGTGVDLEYGHPSLHICPQKKGLRASVPVTR